MDNADKHPDAVARLLASGVGDYRLPNIPAQLAKTVDEIECAAPPAANWCLFVTTILRYFCNWNVDDTVQVASDWFIDNCI